MPGASLPVTPLFFDEIEANKGQASMKHQDQG